MRGTCEGGGVARGAVTSGFALACPICGEVVTTVNDNKVLEIFQRTPI